MPDAPPVMSTSPPFARARRRAVCSCVCISAVALSVSVAGAVESWQRAEQPVRAGDDSIGASTLRTVQFIIGRTDAVTALSPRELRDTLAARSAGAFTYRVLAGPYEIPSRAGEVGLYRAGGRITVTLWSGAFVYRMRTDGDEAVLVRVPLPQREQRLQARIRAVRDAGRLGRGDVNVAALKTLATPVVWLASASAVPRAGAVGVWVSDGRWRLRTRDATRMFTLMGKGATQRWHRQAVPEGDRLVFRHG